MENSNTAPIVEHFSSVTDPRIQKKIKHKLIDIITITICASICGANDWVSVAHYGQSKMDWFKSFLELKNGIPSHDTFGNIFSVLQIDEIESCFLSWIQTISEMTGGQVVAIDGKTLRGSYDTANSKAAMHLVSAWASESGVTLGQVKTEEKSNEITAIPELLDLLEIPGCIVTIDAMGTQKDIAEKIIDKNADYVLALKGNHMNLYEDVKEYFDEYLKNNSLNLPIETMVTVDGDHGRIETRNYYLTSDINWLQGKENWKGLKSIGMAISETDKGGTISTHTRYYINSISIEQGVKTFANAVRKHWGIENKVHWVLDVAFREDGSRMRKGNSAVNFSILRHVALNLLNKEKTLKVGTNTKRLKAGWDNKYLFKVLKASLKNA